MVLSIYLSLSLVSFSLLSLSLSSLFHATLSLSPSLLPLYRKMHSSSFTWLTIDSLQPRKWMWRQAVSTCSGRTCKSYPQTQLCAPSLQRYHYIYMSVSGLKRERQRESGDFVFAGNIRFVIKRVFLESNEERLHSSLIVQTSPYRDLNLPSTLCIGKGMSRCTRMRESSCWKLMVLWLLGRLARSQTIFSAAGITISTLLYTYRYLIIVYSYSHFIRLYNLRI